MDQNERRVIEDLFAKLRQAEDQGGSRDGDAEALIRRQIEDQPAAPYYMAQAIVVQQDALEKAQTRIQSLERELAERPAGGGFLSSLFGGGERRETPPPRGDETGAEPGRYRRAGEGSFLGGAMQTAMGVAGGFLIADAISGLLAPDEAAAATPADEMVGDERIAPGEDVGSDTDFGGDLGGDIGGDF